MLQRLPFRAFLRESSSAGISPVLFSVGNSHELTIQPLLDAGALALGQLRDLDVQVRSAVVAYSRFLVVRGVTALLSPPYTPTYNSAVEVAGGRMKERTMWQARQAATWRDEDFEGARRLANELPRAWNARGRSPDEAWAAREPITESERSAFLDRLERTGGEALAEAIAQGQDVESRWAKVTVERTAIRSALVAHGILQVRRRSIPLPKRLLMCARIP